MQHASDMKLIDAWVNPNFPTARVDPQVARLFTGLTERRQRGTSLGQLIEEMHSAQVEKAVLCAGYRGADNVDWVRSAIAQHPDRFAGSLVVDPRKGMEAVREVERAVRDDRFVLIRMMALETQLAYDDACYYPVYAKCVELGVPVSLNVGIPGPHVPGRCQDPIALDTVCHFFPELRIVMTHGGEPWEDVCVKLMTKWENLHYMTSAFAPRRIPSAVIDYMSRRGSERVIWASDYPILTLDRCRDEILDLPLDQDVLAKFTYANAQRMFFSDST